MKRTIYLAFVIFFVFIGIVIYNKGIQKEQDKKNIVPCEDTQMLQDIKKDPSKLDDLVIQKCTDNNK